MSDLDLIVEAAREAGDLALKMQTSGLRIERKSDGTPVSDGDLAVDGLLSDRLRRARPGFGWLSEESAGDPDRLAAETLFIVDPIDGTRAYIRHKPWWVVSIAVVAQGRPVAGVVHAPVLRETYAAARGRGARLNGVDIAASPRAALEGCRMLADPQLLSRPEWPEPWPPMQVEVRNAVALRVAQVASGAFDATIALSSKAEWDIAAAALIAEEAGALATDHQGRAFRFNTPSAKARSLVCAAQPLHELILARTSPIDLGA